MRTLHFAGHVDQAVAALAEFGTIVFAIEPFQPADLLENWPAILREWLKGNSMADLAGGREVPLRKFIEDAPVYRLVWALEAIRVRAAAMEDAPENPNEGRAALAVETGTPSTEAALLIQSGLPSRISALSALRDCPGNFSNLHRPGIGWALRRSSPTLQGADGRRPDTARPGRLS